jgi:hypothetical protein
VSTPSDAAIRSTMTELTRHAARETPMKDVLAAVTSAAVELVDGVHCADVLLITDGEFRSTAPTSQVAPAVDQAQHRTGQGPCLDAAGPDLIVRAADLVEELRWPRFCPEAVHAGVRSVLSFQLFTHGADRGALNLFGFQPCSLAKRPRPWGQPEQSVVPRPLAEMQRPRTPHQPGQHSTSSHHAASRTFSMRPRATVRAKTAAPNDNYASSANGFLKLMAEMPRICHSCEKHVIYFENLQPLSVLKLGGGHQVP